MTDQKDRNNQAQIFLLRGALMGSCADVTPLQPTAWSDRLPSCRQALSISPQNILEEVPAAQT
ncbi:MAG: hypothetical protein CMI60_17110 [Parvibaculum sp.]|nr:hypothetical protein [Parvibaculum sp.]